MRTPYSKPPLTLTREDRLEWFRYEKAAETAANAYAMAPSVRPFLTQHHVCLCCDVLTEQKSTICLSCQARDPEWATFADDPKSLPILRLNRGAPIRVRQWLAVAEPIKESA